MRSGTLLKRAALLGADPSERPAKNSIHTRPRRSLPSSHRPPRLSCPRAAALQRRSSSTASSSPAAARADEGDMPTRAAFAPLGATILAISVASAPACLRRNEPGDVVWDY